jgi:hypothetical protein
MEANNTNPITIKPQPASDWIQITNSISPIIRITIRDAIGRSMMTSNADVVKTSDLEPGIYYCDIVTTTAIIRRHIVIMK